MDLATYTFALLIALQPLTKPMTWGGVTESVEQRRDRFGHMARDFAAVVEERKDLGMSQRDAVRWLVAVARHEGALARAVDLGIGKWALGDRGNSFCSLQIRLGRTGKTKEGWSGQDLLDDRRKCARVGLRVMLGSMGVCKANGPSGWLSAYAAGNCITGTGAAKEFYVIAEKLRNAPLKGVVLPEPEPERE
jgi:hypothetical protein